MTNPEEKSENQSASSQPAGEATGSDLPPEGQGGPHLPDISEPTSKSLSEQFKSGPATGTEKVIERLNQQLPGDAEEPHGTYVLTTDPPHRCSICNGPNHKACGCEARELQKQIEQDDKTFRSQDMVDEELRESASSRTDQELDREGVDPELVRSFDDYAENHEQKMSVIVDKLSDIIVGIEMLIENTATLAKLQKERADLLKDIKNAG